jgi:TonB family protein
MKHLKVDFILAATLLAIALQMPQAWARDGVEEQLKSDYLDKILTLRHFYEGNHLVFQSDGSLTGLAAVGPWTVDGQISVKKIQLRDRILRIRGRRVCLVFDSKAKSFRDVLASLAEFNAKDRDKLEEVFRLKDIEIEIELSSAKPDSGEISSAMSAVFLASGESMREIVPDFWHDYFDQLEGRPRRVPYADPVYSVKSGEASAPRATHTPDPEFSQEARSAKYQGTMTVSFVVDASGAVRDIAIKSPLGLGLDEKAVEALSAWSFEPGTRNGKPVSVELMVEVNFHLY